MSSDHDLRQFLHVRGKKTVQEMFPLFAAMVDSYRGIPNQDDDGRQALTLHLESLSAAELRDLAIELFLLESSDTWQSALGDIPRRAAFGGRDESAVRSEILHRFDEVHEALHVERQRRDLAA